MTNSVIIGIALLIPSVAIVIYGVLRKIKIVKCGCCELATRTPRADENNQVADMMAVAQEAVRLGQMHHEQRMDVVRQQPARNNSSDAVDPIENV